MDCHKLIYKPIKIYTPYERYLNKKKQLQQKHKKDVVYGEVLKYKEARYPKQFLDVLDRQINPFQYSLDQLKQIFNLQYPDYPTEIVNESIEFVFKKKAREAQMIQESQYVIQYGDQYIRNGRKLIKEDFTYSFFNNYDFSTPPPTDRQQYFTPPQTDRSQRITSRTETPQKLQKFLINSHLFNEVLQDEIKRQKSKYDNLNIIYEGEVDDYANRDNSTMKKQTDRSQNDSFPNFKEKDILVQPEVLDTGRTDAEELNFLLSEVAMLGDENGGQTSRSARSVYTTKLSKENRQNIYNAQGKLKRNILRKAVSRLKKQKGYE